MDMDTPMVILMVIPMVGTVLAQVEGIGMDTTVAIAITIAGYHSL